jgi:hypothetical protein
MFSDSLKNLAQAYLYCLLPLFALFWFWQGSEWAFVGCFWLSLRFWQSASVALGLGLYFKKVQLWRIFCLVFVFYLASLTLFFIIKNDYCRNLILIVEYLCFGVSVFFLYYNKVKNSKDKKTTIRAFYTKLRPLFISVFYFGFLIFCLQQVLAIRNLYKEKTTYLEGIGWVDWGHADPTGARLLLADIAQKRGKNQTISYQQKMFFGPIVAISKQNFVVNTIDTSNQTAIAYHIFKTVSFNFETMQGSFPLNIMPNIRASAFKKEDLNGNKISFYCAYKGINLSDFKKSIAHYTFPKALARYTFDFCGIKAENSAEKPFLLPEKCLFLQKNTILNSKKIENCIKIPFLQDISL